MNNKENSIHVLVKTMEALRDKETGCPWNREQTHQSIKRHLLEETYETLVAIDSNNTAEIREELGDLLFQVIIHSRIAEESGNFNFYEIAQEVNDKMIRRHPHVFGELNITEDKSQQMQALDQMWESVKNKEKTQETVFDSIPQTLPALAYINKILKKADKQKISTELVIRPLEEKFSSNINLESINSEEDMADLFVYLSNIAKKNKWDMEDSLRQASNNIKNKLS